MNASSIKSILTVVFLVVLAGCSRMTSSGIPEALNTDSLILTAGHSQGLTLELGSHGDAKDVNSVESERRFKATISKGTSAQLLKAYGQEVQRVITSSGGEIHGSGVFGDSAEMQDLSYAYTIGKNAGFVRVYSFVRTSNQIEIVSLCHEHLR